jgi:soluble lytic murein transglycosylase-like protein
MEENGFENSLPERRIIDRKKRGVVGTKQPSRSAGVASKVATAVLAAAALGGAAKAINSTANAESRADGASVTLIPRPSVTGQQGEGMESQKSPEPVQDGQSFFDAVFHGLNSDQKTEVRQKVDEFKNAMAENSDLVQAYKDIKVKYHILIEETANKYGISENSLYGLIMVESRGDPNASNPIAAGILQFLKVTGREMGLEIDSDKNIDERFDPVKSIDAAGQYLKINKDLLGDEGYADWSYHAGAGNVMKALEIYFEDIAGIDIGDYGRAISDNDSGAVGSINEHLKTLLDEYNPDVSTVLSNMKVNEFVSGLDDDTRNYIYRVVAGAELLDEQADKVVDLGGGLKIAVDRTPSSSSH